MYKKFKGKTRNSDTVENQIPALNTFALINFTIRYAVQIKLTC